jgi:hypothetical protein
MMRALFIALIGVLTASPVLAQNKPGNGATKVQLTDAEKLEKSGESLNRMKTALKLVLTRVEEARNEKDVVKLNCVNEKLTQIKGLLKVAEQADISLHELLTKKDAGADAEFAKIGIARNKIDGLKGDAEQCIGQLAYIVDEKTTVEVQQPSGLANVDGSGRGSGVFGGRWGGGEGVASGPPVRPPCASCSQ